MYKRSIFILTTLFIFCVASSSTFSQTYGEIFTKDEANKRFGPVLKSVTLQTSSVRGLLNQTNKYIMLKIKGGNVIVLDSKRKVLYPLGKNVNSSDVYSVYSASVMNELLNLSASENIFIEQRSSVLTVSNGAYTLEMAVWCPPFCPDHD